jgi:solute carrier family 25 uncoupling protein 8/9
MAANPQPPSPLKAFLCGGAAACIAEVVTLPIDTAKVRLQLLQRSIQGGGPVTGGDIPSVKLNMISMLRKIATEEGLPALYKGMVPALQRQIVFASLRIGLYKEISNFFKRPGEDVISLPRKILSGLVSGALGITVACPTDLVKVRMQSDRARPGQTPRYPGVLSAYAAIVREEGVKGL